MLQAQSTRKFRIRMHQPLNSPTQILLNLMRDREQQIHGETQTVRIELDIEWT